MADSPGTIITSTVTKASLLRKELGVSGTLKYGGFIRGEEYSRDLQGRLALENYDVMSRSDATTHAALQVCKLPLLAANWSFKAPSEDPGDKERTDFLNREFFDRKIDFFDVANEGLTCLDYGYSVAEIVNELTNFNGKILWGLDKIASRKQLSILKWLQSDGQPGITQLSFGTDPAKPLSIDIPMEKLAVWTNEKRGDNYEGISLLRYAYKHWYLKDKLEIMNAVALERMGLGIPILRTGVGNVTTTDSEIALVEQALRQIRINEEAYIKLPPGLELEMLTAKASEVKDILPTMEYEDTQVLLSVLAQFLGLGMNGRGGSRALSDDHSQLFLRALEAVGRTMARGFQSIANRLIDLNYSVASIPNGYPKLTFDGLDSDDVTAISTALNQLISVGAITVGLDVENRARRLVKIEELSQKDYDDKQAEAQAQAAEQKADIVEAEPDDEGKPQEANPKDDPNADPKAKAKEKAQAIAEGRIVQQNILKLIAGI